MDINDLSKEIKELLKEESIKEELISNKVKELETLILNSNWYSRMCDEIDDPIEELMNHQLYQDALKIILAIKEKEPCSLDMGYYDSKAGICYFELKDYKNAEICFYSAISDDDDYIDELVPYLEKLRNKPGIILTYF